MSNGFHIPQKVIDELKRDPDMMIQISSRTFRYELLTSEKMLTEYKSLEEALEYAYNQIGGLKLGHAKENEWIIWYCVGDKVLNRRFGTITRERL